MNKLSEDNLPKEQPLKPKPRKKGNGQEGGLFDNVYEPEMEPVGFLLVTTRRGLARIVESEAATKVSDRLQKKWAYSAKYASWYQFTGTHWEPLITDQPVDEAILIVIRAGTQGFGFTIAYKNGIKTLLTQENKLPLPDARSHVLPFQNGLHNLATLELEPVTPLSAQTWCLPHDYDKAADCPTIKAWLLQAVGDNIETVEFLRAWMAATLHGRPDLQKFLHLKGSGGTGKGVYFRLLSALMGAQNFVSTSLKQLEQNRFEPVRLLDKRLAIITDSGKYDGPIDVFKSITGEDDVRLERKHQQQNANFVYRGMVMLASNEYLLTTDHTSAIERRRLTAIIDRVATEEEKKDWYDRGGEKGVLHSELPGLVNWLLELNQAAISNMLRNPPNAIEDANREAMKANNPLADWVTVEVDTDQEEWLQTGNKKEISSQGEERKFLNAGRWLYPTYLRWCQRSNVKQPVSLTSFRALLLDTLRTLGIPAYEKNKDHKSGIQGVKFKPHVLEEQDPAELNFSPEYDQDYVKALAIAKKEMEKRAAKKQANS